MESLKDLFLGVVTLAEVSERIPAGREGALSFVRAANVEGCSCSGWAIVLSWLVDGRCRAVRSFAQVALQTREASHPDQVHTIRAKTVE